MQLRERRMSWRGSDVAAAYENAYYLSGTEPAMVRVRSREIADDIHDDCQISYSDDGGLTWSDDQPYQIGFATPAGMVRKDYGIPVADPTTGRLVVLSTTSVLPTDHMLEALNFSFPTYRVSTDGGITWLFEERIIQHGDEFDFDHPIQSVWVGKNAIHYSNMPFFDRRGRLIVPVQITRLQADGTLYCPPGALSFHEMMILIGTWTEDGRISWEASEKLTMEPNRSTRGTTEGAVAEMPDGRFLIVMRGSNSGNDSLPGHKWYSWSEDGCRTWHEIQPWTYADGTAFHSPSSYSTILSHSNGRYFWVGNTCDINPSGNRPDDRLVIGEIDTNTLLLRQDSICEIDGQREDDPAPVHLRNFSVYEERSSTDLVLRMCRLWVKRHMLGDAYCYRIGIAN